MKGGRSVPSLPLPKQHKKTQQLWVNILWILQKKEKATGPSKQRKKLFPDHNPQQHGTWGACRESEAILRVCFLKFVIKVNLEPEQRRQRIRLSSGLVLRGLLREVCIPGPKAELWEAHRKTNLVGLKQEIYALDSNKNLFLYPNVA